MEQVQQILDKLHNTGLQADIDKCKFFVTETKFLGLIVGPNRISIDSSQVQAVCK